MLGESVRARRMLAAGVLFGLMAAGCDEDPITIGPNNTPDGASADMRTDPGPTPDAGPDEPDVGRCEPRSVFEPDPQVFANELAGPLYQSCGLCHYDAEPRPGAPFTLVLGGPVGLSEAQNQQNVDECLAFVDAGDPANSDLIAWHPQGHPGYIGDGPLKDSIVAWIEAGTRVVEPDPADCEGGGGDGGPDPGVGDMGSTGPTGPNQPPCDALLGPEGQGGARSMQFRDEFEMGDAEGVSHNDVLVGSCARNSGCHAIPGEGGGYWLLEEVSDCAIEWNFRSTLVYIDWLSPPESPLLTQPLDDDHGGRDVFRGADDSRHVRLLRWINNEITRSRR